MVFITIVTGAYKPTYNWGASHCIDSWDLKPTSTGLLSIALENAFRFFYILIQVG